MQQLSAKELREKIKNNENIFLIDVREDFERKEFHIGGLHVPFDEIFVDVSLIKKDIPVVFYCKKGVRSLIAIQKLEQRNGFTNLYNLHGGIDAWKQMIEEDTIFGM